MILQSHSKKKEAHALAIEHHIPRLAKHSVAADTPEHYTSMTCSNRALQPGSIAASQQSRVFFCCTHENDKVGFVECTFSVCATHIHGSVTGVVDLLRCQGGHQLLRKRSEFRVQ